MIKVQNSLPFTQKLLLFVMVTQEKSKLESQVKQLVSQKQLLDKNQGKQESMELKKRESIMLVSVRALWGVSLIVLVI